MKDKKYYLYCRCSSKSQKTDSQKRTLKKAFPEGIVFEEKLSGVSKTRPERQKIIDQLDENSVLVCTRMSRLSRSLSDLFSVMETIRAKGANVIFLKEQIDTSLPGSAERGAAEARMVTQQVIESHSKEKVGTACPSVLRVAGMSPSKTKGTKTINGSLKLQRQEIWKGKGNQIGE